MKKLLAIVAILCMAFTTPICAESEGEQVELQVSILKPTSQIGGPHKAPPRVTSMQIPIVFLDGHALYFDAPCDGCTIQLVDEDDFVVYSVTLPNGTTEWELSEALTGEFVLQIICGRYCFFGWIEL